MKITTLVQYWPLNQDGTPMHPKELGEGEVLLIRTLYGAQHSVLAIKCIRALLSIGLADAKQLCDHVAGR